MTNGSNERIDQIEALLAETAQLTRSNAKAIQAMLDTQAEARLEREELRQTMDQISREAASERAELRRATIGIANLLSSLDEDRPTILRKLNTIENKVDRLLAREDGNSDE